MRIRPICAIAMLLVLAGCGYDASGHYVPGLYAQQHPTRADRARMAERSAYEAQQAPLRAAHAARDAEYSEWVARDREFQKTHPQHTYRPEFPGFLPEGWHADPLGGNSWSVGHGL